MWRVLQSEVKSRPYNTKKDLKSAIRDAIANMNRTAIEKVGSRFQSSLEKMVADAGGHND